MVCKNRIGWPKLIGTVRSLKANLVKIDHYLGSSICKGVKVRAVVTKLKGQCSETNVMHFYAIY
jgi:hypothetical protein